MSSPRRTIKHQFTRTFAAVKSWFRPTPPPPAPPPPSSSTPEPSQPTPRATHRTHQLTLAEYKRRKNRRRIARESRRRNRTR